MNAVLQPNRRRAHMELNDLIERKDALSDEELIKLKEQFMLDRQFINACLVMMAQKGIADQDWHKRALMAYQAKRVSIQVCEKELLRRHLPETKPQSKAKPRAKSKVSAQTRAKANRKKMKPLNVTSVHKRFMQKAETMLSPELFKAIYRQAYTEYLAEFRAKASLALADQREVIEQSLLNALNTKSGVSNEI